jgi:hypothetical protein
VAVLSGRLTIGIGDEIIATAQVARLIEKGHRKVAILDRKGFPRWHDIWSGNPHIATPEDIKSGMQCTLLNNGPKMRPYIQHHYADHFVWRTWDKRPGEIYLSPDEERFAEETLRGFGPFVVIEPNIKPNASPNKQWGRWQKVVDICSDIHFVQFNIETLRGVTTLATPTFRHACAILKRAKAYLGPEGGLHHAAAALSVRGVVVFGGYVSPEITGYDLHANLFTGGKPCGQKRRCNHCLQAMAQIRPERVVAELRALL